MAQDSKVQPTNANGVAFGITSLVTGIASFLCGWIFFLSIPIGTVAIVFGALGMKKPASRGLAIAGMVTGIIGVAFGLGILIIGLVASLNAGAPSVMSMPQPMYYNY